MPELTITHIALLAAAAIIGIVLGWVGRGNRTASEKEAINAGWQEQLEAQRNEHERLMDQNKSLMEQNSQYQASNKDAKMRAGELSDALKEAFERLDVPFLETTRKRCENLISRPTSMVSGPPVISKWRTRNPKRISRIIEKIEPTMRQLGYMIDE